MTVFGASSVIGTLGEAALGLPPPLDVGNDELHKIFFAVGNDEVFNCVSWWFARPSCLARRSVTFEARPGCCYPIAKALSGVGKVAVPAEWGGTVLVRIVGA